MTSTQDAARMSKLNALIDDKIAYLERTTGRFDAPQMLLTVSTAVLNLVLAREALKGNVGGSNGRG